MLLLTGISLSLHAQLKKGEKMLGATISFSTDKWNIADGYEIQKVIQAGIVPELAFGLGSNLIAGIGLGLYVSKGQKAYCTMN